MRADGLHAGTEAVPGLAAYRGVLQRGDEVVWHCTHRHKDRSKAEKCALGALERLRAAERAKVKTPGPDNSDYARHRRAFIRELNPAEADRLYAMMMDAVDPVTELVQEDFDWALERTEPGRRRCGCPKDQHIWWYGHMQACGRGSPYLAPFGYAYAWLSFLWGMLRWRPSPAARDLACSIGEMLAIMAVLLSVAILGGVMVWAASGHG